MVLAGEKSELERKRIMTRDFTIVDIIEVLQGILRI